MRLAHVLLRDLHEVCGNLSVLAVRQGSVLPVGSVHGERTSLVAEGQSTRLARKVISLRVDLNKSHASGDSSGLIIIRLGILFVRLILHNNRVLNLVNDIEGLDLNARRLHCALQGSSTGHSFISIHGGLQATVDQACVQFENFCKGLLNNIDTSGTSHHLHIREVLAGQAGLRETLLDGDAKAIHQGHAASLEFITGESGGQVTVLGQTFHRDVHHSHTCR
mmetsp:Transcript_21277/g.35828  ORF Transcript_21277/g.35828 Transcript_21277/m.35828 type:complete len:222 (-) Transcript_21277:890-1555(-)